MGPEMMQKFRDQAERFGARLLTDDATRVQLASEPGGVHRVWVGDTEHRARTVILSMGAEHKKLCIPGEEELGGRGVSYCATCDAAFFRDSQTIVVGGGDSAMEEAIFLSKFAAKVTLVHRRSDFRASKIMLERARAQENIEFLTPYTVREFVAGENGALGHATLINADTRPLHAHQSPRRVRRRRPRRPHLPAGGHRGGDRLPGGPGRRVVPARHARGADARGYARGRPGRGPVGSVQERLSATRPRPGQSRA